MKRWLITVTTIVLLGVTPMAMADRDHERGRGWHKDDDRSDERMKMRVRDPHKYHDRRHRRDNGWHRGHHRKPQWHRDHDRGDRRHRHGYRDHHRYDRDRDRGGVIIGIGDDHGGVVIWNR